MEEAKISWQNKDIISKAFAENLKGKSLEVYGIHVPEVEEVLPTNLPSIQANELRLDNAFRFKDQSIGLIDYESAYSENDKLDYIDYLSRVLRCYRREWKREITVRMIVIYTADVERKQVSTEFNAGCLTLHVDAAFLSELDSAEIWERLKAKILSGERLTEQEKMEFVILPMSYKGNQAKNEAIAENLDLIENMPDDEDKTFLLTGMAVFANKVITETLMQHIERMVAMTRLGQRYADRMQRTIDEADARVAEAEAKAAKVVAEAEAKAAKATAEAEAKAAKATAEAKAKAAEAEAEAAEAKAEAAKAEAETAKAVNAVKAAEMKAVNAEIETEKRMVKGLLADGLSPEVVWKYSMALTRRDIEELRAEL